ETDHVLVNCYAPATSSRAIVPDEEEGGLSATTMLLEQGHERIAFINTTSPSPARNGRLTGYQQALRAARAPFDPGLVFDAQPDQERGYAIADQVLESGATAAFCHNDRMAMGVYDALRERGMWIPEDLSVVGFDNQEVIAGHLRPPLSTVALPHYEMGAAGVRVLLGDQALEPSSFLRIACPPILRASIAPSASPLTHHASPPCRQTAPIEETTRIRNLTWQRCPVERSSAPQASGRSPPPAPQRSLSLRHTARSPTPFGPSST